MSETSDLAKEVRKLRGELATLRNEFAQVRGRQDVWAANGLDDLDAGHGNQRFGAGNFSLNDKGLVVYRAQTGNDMRGIYFTDTRDFSQRLMNTSAAQVYPLAYLISYEGSLTEGTHLEHEIANGVNALLAFDFTASTRKWSANLSSTQIESAVGHRQAMVDCWVDPSTNLAKVQIYAPDGLEISTDAVTWTPVTGGAMRVHVPRAGAWDTEFGTDYWFFINSGSTVAAAPGWTMTALAVTASGLVGDFQSSADIDPYFISFGASGDLLQSPIIFGGYDWQQAQKGILGYAPTKLCAEIHAQFTVHTANEPTSCFGFVKGAASTAGNAVATIYTNGAIFLLTDGTTTDAGAADDGLWHIFRIEISAATTEWFIDGVSQGTIVTETDEFPVAFGAHSFTTNRFGISYIHVWAA